MNKQLIPMFCDKVFKKVWGDPDNVDRLTFLLSIVLKIPFKELKGHVQILESEKRIDNIRQKVERNDIIAKIIFPLPTKLNVEMNRGKFSQSIIDRNTGYIVRIFAGGIREKQSYKDIIPAVQICFNTYPINPNKIIDCFYFKDDENYTLTEKIKIYTIDIAKCKDICYTKSVSKYNKYEQEIIKIGALMMENNNQKFKNQLEEIDMEDNLKKDIKQTMDDLSSDSEILEYFDAEQDEIAKTNGRIDDAREDGRKEGNAQKAREIAKKMLSKKMNLEIITDITGISREELGNLV